MFKVIMTQIAVATATGILSWVAKNNESELEAAKKKLAQANAKAEKMVLKAEQKMMRTHDSVLKSTQIITEAMKLGEPEPLPTGRELR